MVFTEVSYKRFPYVEYWFILFIFHFLGELLILY